MILNGFGKLGLISSFSTFNFDDVTIKEVDNTLWKCLMINRYDNIRRCNKKGKKDA